MKGEIVVVIAPPERPARRTPTPPSPSTPCGAWSRRAPGPRAAAGVVAALTGTRANDLYTGLTGREPRQ